ncbi:hypothetical protein [Tenacibaculum aiptasiae]|uniref:hypothetical protein n=1 Tax=Tenacibaculum aiptasiae TaxID=426481 RepID=UPI003B5BEC89
MNKDKGNRIELEREKVDNYLITACITLIAAFIVILSIKKPSENYISYTYLISLLFLITCLLFSLWHKFRFPIRQEKYERIKDKILTDISGEIADFAEEFVLPASQLRLNKLKAENPTMNDDELKKRVVEGDSKEKTKKVITTYIEKLNYQLKEKSNEIFQKPLEEKNSKLKFRLDMVSKSFRYWAFGIGILFFFVSIFMTII